MSNISVCTLLDKLGVTKSLSIEEYTFIIKNYSRADADYGARMALEAKQAVYGNEIFLRGLIEISSYCRNDCLYCGLRRSNKSCERYRLDDDEILLCCDAGYELGYRTFVLQGGEDLFFTDERLCNIVKTIKDKYRDCAVTLSVGERSRESYERLRLAGADRYLLRHETVTKSHYEKLHPQDMSYSNRLRCLYDLKELDFQTGCGIMVGSPYQDAECIAADLKFIEEFKPQMCGIGPFIPHRATPFGDYGSGSVELCCLLLSLIRLMQPEILLPATTALSTLHPHGHELGILSGANVIMPNLSPSEVRKKYELYDGKVYSGDEAAENKKSIEEKLKAIGCTVSQSRGDIKII